ncbi:MAG: hypothetical protein RR203_02395 [Synergistaceae bacterium]
MIDLADLFSSSHSSDDVGPVDGGSSTPRAVSIVESAECITSVIDSFGGLDVFVDVFCEFEKEMPERAKILRDLSAVGSLRFSSVEDVAWHNHVSKRHLYRLKNASLYQIAMEISRRKMWRK